MQPHSPALATTMPTPMRPVPAPIRQCPRPYAPACSLLRLPKFHVARQAWYDDQSWYPLGRHVGSTTYPGLQLTAWAIHSVLNQWVGWQVSLNDVCVFIPVSAGGESLLKGSGRVAWPEPAVGGAMNPSVERGGCECVCERVWGARRRALVCWRQLSLGPLHGKPLAPRMLPQLRLSSWRFYRHM